MRAIAKGIVATSVCISTVALAGSAFAEPVIDQQAAVSAQGAGYSAWVMENQAMAQPFTAGITGALTRADLSVAPWSSTQSNLLVEIYEMDGGVPVGSALASSAVPAADIQAMRTDRNLNTLTVNFSSPAQVNSGTQYAIVASTTAGEGYHWFMSSTDWLYQNEWSLYGDTRPSGVAGTSWNMFLAGAYATWVDGSVLPGSSGTRSSGTSSDAGTDGASSSVSTQWALSFVSEGDERTVLAPAGIGEWLALPVIEETARSSKRFLGWATSPDFPVTIAERQVENGDGAYEIFNEDGQLTGVFIPARHATQITGNTTFYAIWG